MAKKKKKPSTRRAKKTASRKVSAEPKKKPARPAAKKKAAPKRKTALASPLRSARVEAVKLDSLGIDDLNLSPDAKAAAQSLLEQFPDIVFLSGRRDIAGQANAMAPHVVKDRQWITKTYKDPVVAGELQQWVDDHPEATTSAAIAAGLLSVMNTWDTAKLRRLSWHLTGDAFDLQPVAGPEGALIKTAINALPNLDTFLTKEGNDIVWHVQIA